MSFIGKKLKEVFKDVLHTDNSNSGISTTTKDIKTGNGNNTAIQLSTRRFAVNPADNTTSTFRVRKSDGTVLMLVDTTNELVKLGIGQHIANTQYVHFGIGGDDINWDDASDDTHYAVPFGTMKSGLSIPSRVDLGTATTSSFNDTDPATSLTLSTNADDLLAYYWYVPDNITVDAVEWWHGADAAAGSTVAMHLMAYTVDRDNGSTGGDLSAGFVVAAGANRTNDGYEQLHYESVSPSSPNVNAGSVILFTFCYDDTEATDWGINATVKYHLR